MKIRNPRSIIIISFFALLNIFIIRMSYFRPAAESVTTSAPASLAPEFTEIEELDYFHLKDEIPQMSLSATRMLSQGEETAEFEHPKGIYNYQKKNQVLKYQALSGLYQKSKGSLVLNDEVEVTSDEARYEAKTLEYFFDKDLIAGSGGVHFYGKDPKTQDQIEIAAQSMLANPQNQISNFKGKVQGEMRRKKKYEGKMTFSSQQLKLEGLKSLAHLEGDVRMKRDTYLITAGKADIHLENYNKSLKYFVLNDDVKVTETLETPKGIIQRKAFSERLEGFGREQKMVLSGAPRVEQGQDVIKGYRITIRENVDLIEVDDAMSDVQVKREKKLRE
jgi:lipopolysaccharide transport protein LptA